MPIRCVRCGHDSTVERESACDASLHCPFCGKASEFRQFRETWCQAQRAALTDACPEIYFPHDRLTREYR